MKLPTFTPTITQNPPRFTGSKIQTTTRRLLLLLTIITLLTPYIPLNTNPVQAQAVKTMDDYIRERGFLSPTGTSDYDKVIQDKKSAFEMARDYAVQYGSKSGADPALIVWWTLVETDQSFDPYSYNNCHDHYPREAPTYVCQADGDDSRPDNWQIAYGQQFATAYDQLEKAFEIVHGNPNDTSKVQQVIQTAIGKMSASDTAPSNLTVKQIIAQARGGQPYRKWAFYLSKDPGISSYLLGTALIGINRQEVQGYGGYYNDDIWQRYSNGLNEILKAWGTPGVPSDVQSGGYRGGPTEPPVELVVPDCPGVTRTINAYNIPPSIYPKPNCGGGTPGAGANPGLGSPTGEFGTGEGAPAQNTVFWLITGGKTFPISQGYGLTNYGANYTGPGQMYYYCNAYNTPGHCGIDVSTPVGTVVYAPVPGTVICDGTSTSRGGDEWENCSAFDNQVVGGTYKGRFEMKLENGDYLIMGHMNSIDVRIGDKLKAGDRIGTTGLMTQETGAHFHLEYRSVQNGQLTTYDPRDMLNVPISSTNLSQQSTNSTLTMSNTSQVLAETTTASTYEQFRQKYGFLQPDGVSGIDWDKYQTQFTTIRDAAVKVAPDFNIEPELIVWWVFFETSPPYDPYTYSNCQDTPSLSVVSHVCGAIGYGDWQIGYGQQYAAGLDHDLAKIFSKTHGDPNDTQLVAQVIAEIMQKSGLSNDFSGGKTIAQLLANEPANRKWIFALQRDPTISAYMLAAELKGDIEGQPGKTFAQIMAGWDRSTPYYSTTTVQQLYSNILNEVILNWGIAGTSISNEVCQVGVSRTVSNCSTMPDDLGSFNQDTGAFIEAINKNMAAYKEIAQCANVPWQMMAAIHWRETELDADYRGDGSLGAQGPWQLDPTSALWGKIDPYNFVEAGCALAKAELQEKAQNGPVGRPLTQDMDPSIKENEYSIKDAFFAYNGRAGFEQNEAGGCTRNTEGKENWNFDCSAYVMNNMDQYHQNMTIMTVQGPFNDDRDGVWKVFYKLYYSTYAQDGKMLVYGGNCSLGSESINGFAAPTKPDLQIIKQFSSDHKGIDIKAPQGEAVFALTDGEIITSEYSPQAGYHLIIKVSKGTNNSQRDLWIYYGHLAASDLAPTGSVKSGQKIGSVGGLKEEVDGQEEDNGLIDTPHLHFDIRTTSFESSNLNNHVNPCSLDILKNSYPALQCANSDQQGIKWTD